MEQRHIPVHQSLHRHNLVLGAERELAMTSALIALLVGVGGMTAISGLAALLFWITSIFILRRMARIDPLMSKVWIKQQILYQSKSSRWRSQKAFSNK